MSRFAWYQLAKIALHPDFTDMAYAMDVLALQRDNRISGNHLLRKVKYQMYEVVMPRDVITVANNLGNPEYFQQVNIMLQKHLLPVTPKKDDSRAVVNSSQESPAVPGVWSAPISTDITTESTV